MERQIHPDNGELIIVLHAELAEVYRWGEPDGDYFTTPNHVEVFDVAAKIMRQNKERVWIEAAGSNMQRVWLEAGE